MRAKYLERMAKEILKENQERYELAMKATSDGVYDWNLITNEIYYSPNWKGLIGYEDHELPNDFSIWETLTSPEDVKRSWDMQNKLINKEIDRFEIEFKMKHKAGHWVDIFSRAEAVFDKSGKATRIVGTHIDITNRKQAGESVQKEKDKLRDLINNLDAGVIVHAPDTSIILNNPRASELLGLSEEQMNGKQAIDPEWKFLFEDKRTIPIDEYPVNRVLTTQKPIKRMIVGVIRSRTDDVIWLLVNGFPVFDDLKELVEIIISFVDITDRKQAEEALISHKKQLEAVVEERTKELEAKNKELDNALKVFVGRELTIRDLQNQVRALKGN